MGFFVRRSENSTVEIIFPQGCDFRQDAKNPKTGMSISIAFPIETLHVLAKQNVNQQIAVAILPQPKKYTWPGSNWRPSACWADVIATRPQVHIFLRAALFSGRCVHTLPLCQPSRCFIHNICTDQTSSHLWSSGYDVSLTR